MKAIFINPDWGRLISRKGSRFNRKWPPLCLLNCASLLEKHGLEAEIIDLRAEKSGSSAFLGKISGADRVFVTSSPIDRWQCPNLEINDFFDFLRPLPKENLYIMGAHGTMSPEKVLAATGAKAVIRREPEMTVLELSEARPLSGIEGITYMQAGKVVHNPDRQLLDMGELPVPAYHLIDLSRYRYELLGSRLALLETSRGCPHSCSYCYQGMYGWRQYRRKPLEKVLNEIDIIVNTSGPKSLFFIDLEFTLDRSFVQKICSHIIEKGYRLRWSCQTRADTVDRELLKKMKEAGCRLIHYGVETGSERILASINKKIRLADIREGISATKVSGIETACFFMFGFPGETLSDMEETIKLALELNPTYASFHIASPYPGTALYSAGNFSEMFPEAYTHEHSSEVLKGMVRKAFKRFYLRPAYIKQLVLNTSPASLKRQFRLFREFIG